MKTYKIQIINCNVTLIAKENETVLQTMRRHGLGGMVHGCYGGGCGRCIVTIKQGNYTIRQKMSRAHIIEEDEKQKRVLACCVQPTSDIHIQIQE